MLKTIKCMLTVFLVVILCAGCSQKDAPYISNEYVLEYEGDKCYMVFKGERRPQTQDSLMDGAREMGFGCSSLSELKDSILNHKFTEWQLDRIRLDFSKGDDKRIQICNPNKLYQAVCPEDLELKYFYWQGLSYKWLINRPQIRGEAFSYITEDSYHYLKDIYYEISEWNTVTKTETIEDRNSTIYYYTSSSGNEYKRVCYVLEEGDKTLYIAEENQLNDTSPIYINIMGEQNGEYFRVDFLTEQRPSVEYLLEFGLKEL